MAERNESAHREPQLDGSRPVRSRRANRFAAWIAVWAVVGSSAALAELEDEVGRNETRVYSAPFYPTIGRTVADLALPERLGRLGYVRVRGRRPEAPGEFFWGHENFWIYRQAAERDGKHHAASLFGLRLRRDDGRVVGFQDGAGQVLGRDAAWIEPELIAEGVGADRARVDRVDIDRLPEHVWRAVLAVEDHRFFEHAGVDPRSVARAALKNARAGGVVQGGSTITQQLIKMRDLTPQRNLRRKASEALRALALEAEHDKREILQAYLNVVYYGHVEGVAVHGIGSAARTYYSKSAPELSLGEAAVLAAMIQGPNRLNPLRPGDSLEERYRWALDRMQELGWASAAAAARWRRDGLPRTRHRTPRQAPARDFRRWVGDEIAAAAPRRHEKGKGFIVWTTLDPWLQAAAEKSVARSLEGLRGQYSRLRREPLSAALLTFDTRTGGVVAYVGGDPEARGDRFDRVRSARRQPGSTIKPLLLLEAFERCGAREPLYPARRVADEAIRIEVPGSSDWRPTNSDGAFRGPVSIRAATAESLNVPFVRLARWCGLDATAERLRQAGLELPASPPPSFVLGAVETTMLDLATAYSAVADSGRRHELQPIRTLERSSGRRLRRWRPQPRRVVSESTTYLIRDLLRRAVEEGTASGAATVLGDVFGKTGTSSDRRDAWFVGASGDLMTLVWVGLDSGDRLGLSGASAAAPLWRDFMESAIPTRATVSDPRPETVVSLWVEESTGLVTAPSRRGSEPYLFRRGHQPRRRRIWRADASVPVIE